MMRVASGIVWGVVLLGGAHFCAAEVMPPSFPEGAGPLMRARMALGPVSSASLPLSGLVEDHRGKRSINYKSLPEWAADLRQFPSQKVHLSWPLKPAFGLSLREAGTRPVLADRALDGLTGEGVVVGFVDTGLDWQHPDFEESRGVAWYLDLGVPEEDRHGGLSSCGGAVWSREDLRSVRVGELEGPSPDILGHGTHVAGIVAARAVETPLGADGIAPNADLIVVKANRPGTFHFEEADVLCAVRFILNRADEMGKPAVVNLSLGGQGGPHDGTTLFERELDALFAQREGRVLVVAAGNDGDSGAHAEVVLEGGKTALPLFLPNKERTSLEPGFAALDIWYPVSDSPLEVEVIAPDGRSTGRAAPGEVARSLDPRAGAFSVSHALAEGERSRAEIVVLLQEPEEGEMLPGSYQIVFHGGAGVLDAWRVSPGPFEARFDDFVVNRTTIAMPSTARSAISVGASVVSSSWDSRSGPQGFEGAGDAAFSGMGPSSDEWPKPDIVAPGSVVASSLSRDFLAAEGPNVLLGDEGLDLVLPGEEHGVARGTSVAAPFVSGTAALLLEQDPTRTGEDIRFLLRRSTVTAPWERWDLRDGFGALNVRGAVRGEGDYGALLASATRTRFRYGLDERGFLVVGVPGWYALYPESEGWVHRLSLEASFPEGEPRSGEPIFLDRETVLIPIARGDAVGEGSLRPYLREDASGHEYASRSSVRLFFEGPPGEDHRDADSAWLLCSSSSQKPRSGSFLWCLGGLLWLLKSRRRS